MFVAALAAFAFPSSAQSNGAWEVIHDWGSLPGGLEWGPASQVSASPDGRIIVFRREAPTFVILDADGNLLNSWGDGLFTLAHGIRVDRDGFVWVTDNADNIVQKYTIDGELLLTLGQKGVAGDNASRDAFDGPADVFVDDDGSVYVADGYRNSRIVQFSADGTFIRAIGGTSGDGPGEFDLPHSVVVDSEGRIIVADAGNSRMQVFDNEGNFVEEWTDFPSTPRGAVDIDADDTLYISHVDSEAVTIMRDGEVLEVVYGLEGRPHGVTVDNDGNIYVANTGNRMVKKVVRRR
jgi:DNA-binding beta-propeller fold protein YncE